MEKVLTDSFYLLNDQEEIEIEELLNEDSTPWDRDQLVEGGRKVEKWKTWIEEFTSSFEVCSSQRWKKWTNHQQ